MTVLVYWFCHLHCNPLGCILKRPDCTISPGPRRSFALLTWQPDKFTIPVLDSNTSIKFFFLFHQRSLARILKRKIIFGLRKFVCTRGSVFNMFCFFFQINGGERKCARCLNNFIWNTFKNVWIHFLYTTYWLWKFGIKIRITHNMFRAKKHVSFFTLRGDCYYLLFIQLLIYLFWT